MKYSSHLYARALGEVLDVAPSERYDEILGRFLMVLKKNGDHGKLKVISALLRDRMIKKNGGRHILLEFARQPSPEQIANTAKSFSERDSIDIQIRPERVAGVRIVINGEEELDNTLERKLQKIFR